MLRTDFFVDLYIRVPLEECTIDWNDELESAEGQVFDRKKIEKFHAKV